MTRYDLLLITLKIGSYSNMYILYTLFLLWNVPNCTDWTACRQSSLDHYEGEYLDICCSASVLPATYCVLHQRMGVH